MSITITQLKAFLAVVRGGSVTAAAEELVVTQPSVSAAVAALGREVGSDLLERSGRGVRLTEAGTAFAPYARDIVGLLDAGRRAALAAADATTHSLRIAAVTTAAESFVPALMQAFGQAHPDAELTLAVGNNEEVLARVLSHEDDVGVSGRPPTSERLIALPFLENEIVCITSVDDAATSAGPVAAATLTGRTWLLRERGSGTRAMNERFLADRGLAPRTLTLGSNGAIKQAARAHLGVSLISRAAVETEFGSGTLGEIRLTDGPEARPWFVVRSAIGPTRPLVEQFSAFARSAAGAGARWLSELDHLGQNL